MPQAANATTTGTPTWLVYCPGRATQASVHGSRADADALAERLSRQWPGHVCPV